MLPSRFRIFLGLILVIASLVGASAQGAEPQPGDGWWSEGATPLVRLSEPEVTALPDGRIFILNQRDDSADPGVDAQIYDPETDQYISVARPPGFRGEFDHPTGEMVTLTDGRVFALMGTYAASALIYDPPADDWSEVPGIPDVGREAASTILPDGRVVVISRQAGADGYVYDPDSLETVPFSHPGVYVSEARIVTLPDGRVAFRGSPYGGPSKFYVLDPDTLELEIAVHTLPYISSYRDSTFALPDGRVLLVGQNNSAEWISLAVDVADGTSVQKTLPFLGSSAGALMGDGTVVMTSYLNTVVYSPTSDTWRVPASNTAPWRGARRRVVVVGDSVYGFNYANGGDIAYPVAIYEVGGPTVTIDGTAMVGSSLALTRGPAASPGVTMSWRWYRDGTAAAPASTTPKPFVLTAKDLDASITLRVTLSEGGDVITMAESNVIGPVGPRAFTSVPTPRVTGTPKVALSVRVTTGNTVPGTTTYTRQWLRDGDVIAGATAASYKLVSADAGRLISVRVSYARVGYVTETRTSATVAIAAQVVVKPTITGQMMVGQTITGSPGTWEAPGYDFAYLWLRNGAPIAGQTGLSYTLVTADKGKPIAFRVIATKPGFPTVVSTSVSRRVA